MARPEQAIEPDATALYGAYHEKATYETPAVIGASLDRLVASTERFRRNGRWLDLGFGEGALLSAAQKRGWGCYGIEVSPHAIAHGENRGWAVTRAAGEDARFIPESFDVVSMVEVIEHLADPVTALQQAVRWLRPGGLLYLTTPNANSLNRRLLGHQWSIFCPPEHVIIWSAAGLRKALRAVGVATIRLRTQGLNPVEIIARFRRRAGATEANRQGAAIALNEALARTPSRRALKVAVNAGLGLLGVGDTLKAWCEKPQ